MCTNSLFCILHTNNKILFYKACERPTISQQIEFLNRCLESDSCPDQQEQQEQAKRRNGETNKQTLLCVRGYIQILLMVVHIEQFKYALPRTCSNN